MSKKGMEAIDDRVRAAARIHYGRMHEPGDGFLPDEYALGASVIGEQIFLRNTSLTVREARTRALDLAFEEKAHIDKREM